MTIGALPVAFNKGVGLTGRAGVGAGAVRGAMSESEEDSELEAAIGRFDRSVGRLEASLRGLEARVRTLARIEADTRQLINERARLAADLDKASARAKRLDDSAHDVSRRLVNAMETVREVLAK